jgi:NitT/TauT family transport system substrate-binding protein
VKRSLLALPALPAVLAVLAIGAAAGCSSAAATSAGQGTSSTTLRLGYLPNLTHAPALVGAAQGYFATALGPQVKLQTQTFNAGPVEVTSLLSGALDAAFMGPSPAIAAYTQSHGAVVVVAGAASGGAALVVQPGITTPAALRGHRVADPQLGNTQDVALRHWLSQQSVNGVLITPQSNSLTVSEFITHQIAGAWVPEPYAAQLVVKGHGHVLVDERSLWPGRRFATTLLVVRAAYLRQHPDVISHLLTGEVRTVQFLSGNPAQARVATNAALAALTGKLLSAKILRAAFDDVTFTVDPIASSVIVDAAHARQLGLLKTTTDLAGIFDLTPLNTVLAQLGQPPVSTR